MDESLLTAMGLYIILDRAWRSPFQVSEHFAVSGAMLVALAASEGFITTNLGNDNWGDHWIITEIGMQMKEELNDVIAQIYNTKEYGADTSDPSD